MSLTGPADVDVEPALVAWLQTAFPLARVCTETPANLEDIAQVIQVTRIGGADRLQTLDDAVVDVDCFASTRDASRSLAYGVRHALRYDLPGTQVDGGQVKAVGTIAAPAWRPHTNTNVRRFGATYQITIHASA